MQTLWLWMDGSSSRLLDPAAHRARKQTPMPTQTCSCTCRETQPASVMNEALVQHGACLRALLAKHRGYESATEGDSFIIAFSSPVDGLRWDMKPGRHS